jgi:superfamily II DNA or RNA helicase
MNDKLFEVLHKNTAQAISMLTDEKTFQRGRIYCSEGRAESFSWDKQNEGRLIILIRGSKEYRVTIKLMNETLRCLCTCPAWQMEHICKHIICALLAAREELTAPPAQPEKPLPVLTDNMKNNGLITIHLLPANRQYSINPSFQVVFMRGQEKLGPRDFSVLSLEASLCMPSMMVISTEDRLSQLLHYEKRPMYGITVHVGEGPVDVIWNSVDSLTAITELDLIDNTVNVRRIASTEKGVLLDNLVRIGNELVVDMASKRLLPIGITFAWRWAEYILFDRKNRSRDVNGSQDYNAADNDYFDVIAQPLSLKSVDFNERYPLEYPEKNFSAFAALFIIKRLGDHVTPQLQSLAYIVDGVIDAENKSITLTLQATVDGEKISVYGQLIDHIQMINDDLPVWLRTKKRREMIIKALFALICAKTPEEADDIIKAAIINLRRSVDGAKRYVEIKRYFASFRKIIELPTKEMLIVSNGEFKRIALNPTVLWRALPLVASVFGSSCFDESSSTPSFTLPQTLFYLQLTTLKKLLDADNIELRLNNKRLETLVLDVSVKASNRGGSDWLNISPHIMADGITLSDKQREVLYSSDGNLIETADCIKILDSQSQEIIKMLARMFMLQGDGMRAQDKNSIVQIPRLRVLDLLELRQSGATVTLSNEDEQLLSRLSNFEKIEKIALPKQFAGILRDYQKNGYRWLAFLYKNRFGACLADDMGLGKTIQTIAFLGGIAEGIIANRGAGAGPHLIVVPPTLVFNWQHELEIFYPSLRVMAYTGVIRNNNFNDFDVVLTTYDRVRLDIDSLRVMQFHVLILDEAQAIKNIEAARTAAVRQLKSVFTISLTGTPLENHLGEYHSIVDVALPGLLPAYKLFMRCVQDGTHDSFIKKTHPFVLRRTKDAILHDLPPKVESNVFLNMAEKQQKVYATTIAEVKRLIDQAYEMKTAGQANIIALTAILRLRQICISPQMLDITKESPSPKIDYLTSSLNSITQEGNAALVFSQFTVCLDLIELALKKAGLPYYRIDGKTSMANRRKIIESFQTDDAGVSILLLSLKTGGVGLNLTRANYVFHIDPWWNPAVENQASDRSHRIGQKNKVFVTRLVMHHTIEEKMMTLKETKQKLFSEVMEQAENKTKSMITKKDIDLLLS